MDREVEAFVRFCRFERRLAEQTCRAYERDVGACLAYLREAGFASWSDVRPPDLREFLAAEAVRRPAASSQARTVAALKGFFRFCPESEWLERDPALVLRTPKKREALPDVLDRAELKRLMRAPDLAVWDREHHGKRERDRLLLALFAYAGLRRSELLGLDWDDVDLHRGLLRVRHAKGGRQRVVPIHPALGPLFSDYLNVRQPIVEQALFIGVQGRRLSETKLSQLFGRYVDAAGVNERKRDAAHAAPRLRVGAAPRRSEPAPDPRAARPPPPRLDAALHAGHRAPTPRRDQAAAVVRSACALRRLLTRLVAVGCGPSGGPQDAPPHISASASGY